MPEHITQRPQVFHTDASAHNTTSTGASYGTMPQHITQRPQVLYTDA